MGKKRIEDLLEVIGKQFDDLKAFYDSLNTERSLATAIGAQLDGIGSIAVLKRSEAGLLIQDNEDFVIDDETYRYILAYKIMLNSGSATYYDIIRSIKQFYNLDITYSETPEDPAAFTLEVGLADANVPLRNILPVKAAGVLCRYAFRLGGDRDAVLVSESLEAFPIDGLECGMPLCGTHWQRATIGRTDEHEVDAEIEVNGYAYNPDLTGTIPQVATLGRTDSIAVNVSMEDAEYTSNPNESGTVRSGQ